MSGRRERDPARERERMIQFLSTVPAVGLVFLLRELLGGTGWAILAGIVAYFVIGVVLERKIPPPVKPGAGDENK